MSFGPCIAELDAALNRKKKKIEKTLFYISLCFAKLISRVLEIKVHKGAKRVNCRQMGSTSLLNQRLLACAVSGFILILSHPFDRACLNIMGGDWHNNLET